MRYRPKYAITLLVTAALAPSVQAETRNFGTAGGFEVGGQGSTRDKAGACIATFDYAGPGSTKTTIFRTAEADDFGIVWFSVVNFEWSAKERESYELQYWFDDQYYERTAIGVKTDYIYKGFMAGFPADEFLKTYAKARSLDIFMGETVVDKLSLTGSSAGVALFNRCWSWLQGTERAAQKERDRYKDIPRDPFAKQED